MLSCFSCVWLCVTPKMAAHQALPSLGFSRQEHWSGLPFPSPMHESEKWKWIRTVLFDSQWPHGLQSTRLLHPWDFPGKSTGVGCHCLLLNYARSCQNVIFKSIIKSPFSYKYKCICVFVCVCGCLHSVAQSYPTLCDPTDCHHQAPLFIEFCRQEHWSGLPFPSPMHESEKWKWSRSRVSDS